MFCGRLGVVRLSAMPMSDRVPSTPSRRILRVAVLVPGLVGNAVPTTRGPRGERAQYALAEFTYRKIFYP